MKIKKKFFIKISVLEKVESQTEIKSLPFVEIVDKENIVALFAISVVVANEKLRFHFLEIFLAETEFVRPFETYVAAPVIA